MKGENYILVIAIDKYIDSSFLSLNNAKLDAKKLIDVLVSKYGYKTIKKPLFDNEANRSSIKCIKCNLAGALKKKKAKQYET
ncbi:MAG: hypothetical protein HY841_13605 [Bacteroidetes bacterium]|nr:hypothetical protein [Bacteroidota bacterium]